MKKDREPVRFMDEFRAEKERAPEPIEILPENFGDLKVQEAAPIFSRAAARIEITKPKNDFWQGVSENLRGAVIYFEAQKAKIASKTVRGIVGASLATNLLVACSPRTVEAFPPPEPTPTVFSEPTPSPEAIANLESSVQEKLEETFPTLGLHETRMEGVGFLSDSEGKDYALFTSLLPDPNTGVNLELLLLSEVGPDNSVVWVKGLVRDETEVVENPIEFLGVGYDSTLGQLILEGPLLRTNTTTGSIEIFKNGTWEELNGNSETVDQVVARLGGNMLTAPALPTATPEQNPTPEISPIESGMTLPGVVGVEQRNGKWVGINEQGLSIYRYNEETTSFDEIELITPQDITDEDRLYDRDRGQGRVEFPFGFYPSDLPTGVDGFKTYVLFGVLLEEPFYLEEKRLIVYIVGIPRGNEFLVLQVFGGVSEYQQYPVSIVAEKIPQSPAGGFTFTRASLDLIPVTEAAEVLGRGVGRQIALDLTFYESPEEQIGSLDWYMETGGPANDCKENCAIGIREMKKHLDETYETIGYLRNNDPRYDSGKIYGMYATASVPMPLRE